MPFIRLIYYCSGFEDFQNKCDVSTDKCSCTVLGSMALDAAMGISDDRVVMLYSFGCVYSSIWLCFVYFWQFAYMVSSISHSLLLLLHHFKGFLMLRWAFRTIEL